MNRRWVCCPQPIATCRSIAPKDSDTHQQRPWRWVSPWCVLITAARKITAMMGMLGWFPLASVTFEMGSTTWPLQEPDGANPMYMWPLDICELSGVERQASPLECRRDWTYRSN